jgi:hypothetical protein
VVLICNIAEVLYIRGNDLTGDEAASARRVLSKILECWMDKLSILAREAPALVEAAKAEKAAAAAAAITGTDAKDGTAAAAAAAGASAASAQPPAAAAPAQTAAAAAAGAAAGSAAPPPPTGGKYKELFDKRTFLSTLLMALKNTLSFLEGFGKQLWRDKQNQTIDRDAAGVGMTEEETRIASRILSAGVRCLCLVEGEPVDTCNKFYEKFTDIFQFMENRTFLEIFTRRFPLLYQAILDNTQLRHIAQLLLCSTMQQQIKVRWMFTFYYCDNAIFLLLFPCCTFSAL